tara:strand:+ start:197 stop:526 length:330 start_codon:yes stop_codon:yes gene_type:complete
MKKIKLTVAALLLGGMCYAQQSAKYDEYSFCGTLASNTFKAQWAYLESRATIEDVIEWMHSDIQDGRVQQDVGELYLQNLIDLLSRLEDINAGLITEPFIECENCDEID